MLKDDTGWVCIVNSAHSCVWARVWRGLLLTVRYAPCSADDLTPWMWWTFGVREGWVRTLRGAKVAAFKAARAQFEAEVVPDA